MKVPYRFIIVVLLISMASIARAIPFGIEARSLAMGNTSVATANIATAPFSNPAMLAYQKANDDFALLVPAVGLMLDDSDGVIDLIDKYRATSDQNEQLAIVNDLFGREVKPQLAAAVSLGYAGRKYAMALSARSDVYGSGSLSNQAVTTAELSDPAKNLLNIEGVTTTEIGVSGAMNTRFLGKKVSFGVTPKVINVEQTFFSESISTIDTDSQGLLDSSQKRDLGSYSTVDVGAVMELTKSIHIGIVARNLIEHKIRYVSVTGQPSTVTLATNYRSGIAYRNKFMTLGADLDLNEVAAPISTAQNDKNRMLSVGAEFNAFDIAQLRFGVQKNIASGISEGAKKQLLTAGVGFWLGFHLDITAVVADDVFGVFAQTGFRF